jgi:hypothetical protein
LHVRDPVKSGRMAEPVEQGGEMSAISFPHRNKFQAHATTVSYMPHYSVGPDLAFLNQKFNLCPCPNDPWPSRFDKHLARTQISNSRSVITPFTTPVNPNALRRIDSRVAPPCGRHRLRKHMTPSPAVFREMAECNSTQDLTGGNRPNDRSYEAEGYS